MVLALDSMRHHTHNRSFAMTNVSNPYGPTAYVPIPYVPYVPTPRDADGDTIGSTEKRVSSLSRPLLTPSSPLSRTPQPICTMNRTDSTSSAGTCRVLGRNELLPTAIFGRASSLGDEMQTLEEKAAMTCKTSGTGASVRRRGARLETSEDRSESPKLTSDDVAILGETILRKLKSDAYLGELTKELRQSFCEFIEDETEVDHTTKSDASNYYTPPNLREGSNRNITIGSFPNEEEVSSSRNGILSNRAGTCQFVTASR